MNELQPPTSTDLILQLFGGNRNGELIAVDTQKCLLGSEQSAEGDHSSQCAIFRGPNGATFRSYCDNILVNGEPKTTHWLSVGDKIEFPNSIMIEIQQLGSCEIEQGEEEGSQNNEKNLMQDSTSHSETKSDNFASIPNNFEPRFEESQADSPKVGAVEFESPKLDELESQITEIRLQSEQFDGRFEHLEDRLNQLTDKISQLVDIATSNQAIVPTGEQQATTVSPQVDRERETAQAIEDAAVTDAAISEESVFSEESSFEQTEAVADIESYQGTDAIYDPQPTDNELTPGPVNEDFDSFEQQEQEFTSDDEPSDFVDSADSNSDSFESEVTVEDSSTAFESTDHQEEEMTKTDVSPAEPKNESVADLLARMKEEGQWSGIPDENDASDEAYFDSPTQPEPAPAYVDSHTGGNEDEDADVEDYMSQLLSRMRGGAPAQPVKKEVPEQKAKEPVESTPAPEIPVKPLRPEEFVPKQKAKKIESLGAMRELANSTARTAVKSSEINRRRALAYLQLGIGVASLVMSGYYFGVESQAIADMGFLIGILCIGVTGFLAYRFYKTMALIKEDGGTAPTKQEPKADTQPIASKVEKTTPA